MTQTKKRSALEAVANVVVGYLVAVGMQLLVFPLFDIVVPLSSNFIIGLLFTIASLIRSYVLRRIFNKLDEPRLRRELSPEGREARRAHKLHEQLKNEGRFREAEEQSRKFRASIDERTNTPENLDAELQRVRRSKARLEEQVQRLQKFGERAGDGDNS